MCFGSFSTKSLIPPTPDQAVKSLEHPDVMLKNQIKELKNPSLATPLRINPATNSTGLQVAK